MQLILLERVAGLGNVGDEVVVKAGYGRNFLLPHSKAIIANAGNRNLFERRRKALEASQLEALNSAKSEAEKMSALELSVTRATSDGTHLYGSVSTADLAALLAESGFEIPRREIMIDEQIKKVGSATFRVRLHPDVTAELSLKVLAESI
ncbi:MAG: 50S ribosomal protein L9 [Zetaproteobacteria bacterium]|nr:50S ribosomal protein L9 [Zetaproteobacteria bacterium]